jgi:hypothetical protein
MWWDALLYRTTGDKHDAPSCSIASCAHQVHSLWPSTVLPLSLHSFYNISQSRTELRLRKSAIWQLIHDKHENLGNLHTYSHDHEQYTSLSVLSVAWA